MVSSVSPRSRPVREKARSHAVGTYCDAGRMREWRYAFLGDMIVEAVKERRDVACFRVSLSVQDLLRVGGASGREGLQRTAPRREKLDRPRSAPTLSDPSSDEMVGGALVQGVASSWASMVSSMLASPQGASEQYM